MGESRSNEEIQKEYGQVCAEIGQRSFNMKVMEAEMNQLYMRVDALRKEFQSLSGPKEEKQADANAELPPVAINS